MLTRLRNALAILSVLIWFHAFFLYLHYDAMRPTSRQPVDGSRNNLRLDAWREGGKNINDRDAVLISERSNRRPVTREPV